MDSQENDSAAYSNRAITDYTGGSRVDLDQFSQFSSEFLPHQSPDFYQDEPLKIDNFDTSNQESEAEPFDGNPELSMDLESFEDNSTDDDWQTLKTWLMNERGAPILLKYRSIELENLAQLINFQLERIQSIVDSADSEKNFESIILQTDVERTKYIIRSYLRTRIQKIEENFSWYATTDPKLSNITKLELDFAKNLEKSIHKYYNDSFLNDLPQQLRALDGTDPEGLSLIPEPNLNAAVFVIILKGVGDFQLASSGDVIQMNKNNIFITSYSNIAPLLESGHAKLI
ncbi:hypothetical protein BB560_005626 [Smittium megazygosporum]|uniref:DNA replication complex GINS protein SLD5 n=1 Tax=Smittium megazygosporum TaxID=133381 RepID=A0A2T9Z276_9FUNG|nr:hypothetical protein BB560_005626 [Smittium megazygosporum]